MSTLFSPGLLLAILVSAGYAAIYHLWLGRNLRDLLAFLIAAGCGFAFGQEVGRFTQFQPLQIGQIYLLEASIGAWLAMVLIQLLGQPLPKERRS